MVILLGIGIIFFQLEDGITNTYPAKKFDSLPLNNSFANYDNLKTIFW